MMIHPSNYETEATEKCQTSARARHIGARPRM